MKTSVPPHASPILSKTAAADRGQVRSAPGIRVAAVPGVLLTRSQRREIERRRRVLEAHGALVAKGLSQQEAAKELRISTPTLWRYRRRIEPLTANCGRKSILEKFNPPARVLSLVRRLQLGGMGNAEAWRAAASDPVCPPDLARYLQGVRYVSASLLRATKLIRRNVTVLECPEFSLVEKPAGEKFHGEQRRGI